MSMRKYDTFWMSNKSWWHWNEAGDQILNDDAPEEAKKSYAHYLEQREEVRKNIHAGKYME